MNPDLFIRAEGELAKALIEAGQLTRVCVTKPTCRLAVWRDIQRKKKGHYYLCETCGGRVLVKSIPGSDGKLQYAAHDGNTADPVDCPFSTRSLKGWIPDLEQFGAKFFALPTPTSPLSLRFDRQAKTFARNLGAMVAKAGDFDMPARRSRSAHSPFGFLQALTESAGLSHYWPDRPYARDFTQIIPHLARRCDELASHGLLAGIREKLVFPEMADDFMGSVKAACDAPSKVSGLAGKAIVMGRLFRLEFMGGAPSVAVTLTGMRSSRLWFDSDQWNMHVLSFGKAHQPQEIPGGETLFIAIVSVSGDNLQTEMAAWSVMNRFGILAPNPEPYEWLAMEQFIEHGFTFARMLQQKIRVGSRTMVVDFAALAQVLATKDSRWIIVEVDPRGSAKSKPSKRRRTAYCAEAKDVIAISHDPLATANVVNSLAAKGLSKPV